MGPTQSQSRGLDTLHAVAVAAEGAPERHRLLELFLSADALNRLLLARGVLRGTRALAVRGRRHPKRRVRGGPTSPAVKRDARLLRCVKFNTSMVGGGVKGVKFAQSVKFDVKESL